MFHGESPSLLLSHYLDQNYHTRVLRPVTRTQALGSPTTWDRPLRECLAAPLVAADVLRNLKRLHRLGMSGQYGFYEAIDFTPTRMPDKGGRGIVLRTYMAHHQGMALVALDNALHDYPMQQRFHSDPRIQSADLLLQERIPHQVPMKNPPIELADRVPSARDAATAAARVYRHRTRCRRDATRSRTVIRGMVTNAGGGYSRASRPR